jgi:hydrogenase maturation factor
LVQITSDIELSGAGCTTAITPNQLVQSSSENDRNPETCAWCAAARIPGRDVSQKSVA